MNAILITKSYYNNIEVNELEIDNTMINNY